MIPDSVMWFTSYRIRNLFLYLNFNMLTSRQILPFAVITLFCACGNADDHSGKTTNDTTSVVTENPVTKTDSVLIKELMTGTGKTILLEESHPMGLSMSDFTVSFKGDTTTRLKIADQDPMSTHFLADLDANGFDELYLITISAGSGSYGKVCGFASNKDKSFSFIYFPEITEKEIQPGELFEGYEGKDAFTIEGKNLIRQFAVGGDGKKIKTIRYELKKTETGFALAPSL